MGFLIEAIYILAKDSFNFFKLLYLLNILFDMCYIKIFYRMFNIFLTQLWNVNANRQRHVIPSHKGALFSVHSIYIAI